MALPQRQLSSDDSGGFEPQRLKLWPVTYWLVTLNVILYIMQFTSRGVVTEWGDFSPEKAIYSLQIWRFITFQFLHFSPLHLLLNMAALYYFGNFVEARLGPKRYLGFYLICGICGALFYLAMWRMGFIKPGAMIGASAGIFGVLLAVVHIAPRMVLPLAFPRRPVRVQTLALIFIAASVATILFKGPNAGGEAAHLGGAFAGWVIIRNRFWLNVFDKRFRARPRFWSPRDPTTSFFRDLPR
ncbi:MAG TPA: rhomboid family intramembrane serine protease [Tepidisphaeraceae bacterium]|jgi:membrane associated rhomboid family serine protease